MRTKFDRPVTKIVTKTTKFFEQFRGKRMIRIMLIYAGGSIALIHFFELVFKPILDLNVTHSIISLLAVMVLAGFPIILLFGWATNPDRKKPGLYSLMKLSVATALSMSLLLVAVFVFSRFIVHYESKRVFAILPFQAKENREEEKMIAERMYKKIMQETDNDITIQYISIPAPALDSFRQNKLSLKKIARQTGANTFITAAIQTKDSTRFQIRLMLINQKGRNLLPKHDTYEISALDIFDLESNQVARLFGRKLNEWAGKGKWTNKPAVKVPKSQARIYADTAFRAYYDLKDSIALENFTKALEIDPSFALAHYKIAETYFFECMRGMSFYSQRLESGKRAFDKARGPDVVLDNEDARYVNTPLLWGDYYILTHQYDSAATAYRNAYYGDLKNNYLCDLLIRVKIKAGQWDSANYYADRMFRNLKYDLKAVQYKMRLVLSLQRWDDFSIVANDYLLALNKEVNRDLTNYRYSYYYSVFQNGFLSNLDGARRLMRSIDSTSGTILAFNDQFNLLDLLDNNYDPVIDDLKPFQRQYSYWTDEISLKSLLLGQVYLYAHRIRESEDQFKAALDILSFLRNGNEDDFRWHQSLGLAYAGLGQKMKAIEEGNLALKLIAHKDADAEVTTHIYRAIIYAILAIKLPGEKSSMADLCIQELGILSSKPGVYNGTRFYFPFKADPLWSAVKDDARFDGLWEINYLKLTR